MQFSSSQIQPCQSLNGFRFKSRCNEHHFFVMAIARPSNEVMKFEKLSSGLGSRYAPLDPFSASESKKHVASYSRSRTSLVNNTSYRWTYEAFLNSGKTLKLGSDDFTGLIEVSVSSSIIRYPSHGRSDGLKAPSRKAAQRSVALPIASSVRLLKLLRKRDRSET